MGMAPMADHVCLREPADRRACCCLWREAMCNQADRRDTPASQPLRGTERPEHSARVQHSSSQWRIEQMPQGNTNERELLLESFLQPLRD
jgi:hypothetical protein